MRFTETQITAALKSLKPAGKHSDPHTTGLQLIIGAKTATWYLKRKQPLTEEAKALRNAGATMSIKLGRSPLDRITDVDGQPLSELETARTLAKAIAAQIDADGAYRSGETEERARRRWDRDYIEPTDATLPTFAEVFAEYCEAKLLEGKRQRTIEDYEGWNRRELGTLQDLPMDQIDRRMVQDIVTRLAKVGKVSTAHHVRRLVQFVFNFAARDHDLNNPAGKGKLSLPAPKKRKPKGTLQEAWEAIETIADPWLRAAWVFGVFTSIRRGDICRLKWQDVDLEAKTVTLIDTKQRDDVTLPLSDYVVDVLKALPRKEGSDLVFPNTANRSRNDSLYQRIRTLGASEDTPEGIASFHDTRKHWSDAASRAGLHMLQWEGLRGAKKGGMADVYVNNGVTHDMANRVAAEILSALPDRKPTLTVVA